MLRRSTKEFHCHPRPRSSKEHTFKRVSRCAAARTRPESTTHRVVGLIFDLFWSLVGQNAWSAQSGSNCAETGRREDAASPPPQVFGCGSIACAVAQRSTAWTRA